MASEDRPMFDLNDYTIGWVCVTSPEYVAAQVLLDRKHQCPPVRHDDYHYVVGQIGEHNVVIARSIGQGSNSATHVAMNMVRSFKKIRSVLMVGIGGGATTAPVEGRIKPTTEIFLGDVVVSNPGGSEAGVIQYDMGKRVEGEFHRDSHTNKPPLHLISAANFLKDKHALGQGRMHAYIEHGKKILQRPPTSYEFPSPDYDILFPSEYSHSSDKDNDLCEKCDRSRLKKRSPRGNAQVHYGLIASANTLLRDGKFRDNMRESLGVLCFEMEAAGLMNSFPCLVIRGISDYADDHKNNAWQAYAALTAAAYTKDLLMEIQPQHVSETEFALEALKKLGKKIDDIGVRSVKNDEDSRRGQILRWLPCLDSQTVQQRLIKERIQTRKWLLEIQPFKRWIDGVKWQLQLYGEAGVGKTNSCAYVIQYLEKIFPNETPPRRPIIYIYLNDEDDQRGKHTECNIIGSLVKQLISIDSSRGLPVKLQESFSKGNPTEFTMKESFEELLERYHRTYLIVDGLYKCSEGKVSTTLEKYFVGLIKRELRLSLLTTSLTTRQVLKEVYCENCRHEDLNVYFTCDCNEKFDLCLNCSEQERICPHCNMKKDGNDTVMIEVSGEENDIFDYCYYKLRQSSELGASGLDRRKYAPESYARSSFEQYLFKNPEAINQIAQEISQGAQRNFLIAKSWLTGVLESKVELATKDFEDIRSHLFDVRLEALRKCFVERIEAMNNYKLLDDPKMAFNAIMVVMAAYRPLDILALQQALSLKSSRTFTQLKDRLTISNATNGLIVIDPRDSKVRLFHHALGEVGVERLHSFLEAPHTEMAKICLDYLRHEEFSKHSQNLKDFPLLPYVLEHWGDHVREACLADDFNIRYQAINLLSQPEKVKEIAQESSGLTKGLPSSWIHKGICALHICAWFDLGSLIKDLPDRDNLGASLNLCDFQQIAHCPLRYACVKGNVQTVYELLKLESLNSRVSTKDFEKSIEEAIVGLSHNYCQNDEPERRVEIVKAILKNRDLTLNYRFDGNGKTVLMHAVENYCHDFVRKLLEDQSVDVRIQDREGRTALSLATDLDPINHGISDYKEEDRIVVLLRERYRAQKKGHWSQQTALSKGYSRSIERNNSIRGRGPGRRSDTIRPYIGSKRKAIHAWGFKGNLKRRRIL